MRIRMPMVLLGTMFALALFAGPAAAKKNCHKLCKDIHTACIANAKLFYPCKTVDKSQKKTCKQGFKDARKTCSTDFRTTLANCKASSSTTTCSPSGAFID